MRYIRTNGGRIIDLKRKGLYNLPIYNFDTKENVLKAHQNQEDRNCCCIDNNIFYDYCYEDGTLWEYEIVNQVDTIEELVDEYIAKKANGKPFVIKRYEIYSNLQFGFTIYGAIWVGADLHSVAKMNEKGELELL